ncbi:MAG: hypothetical protein GY714_13340 [Desulfobacterales bacterium]|nr:hypothetical protein [Desulfobacterales bacterium]MCP4159549.1 hypothetical protein [Deltaproteobacteria bacterium]
MNKIFTILMFVIITSCAPHKAERIVYLERVHVIALLETGEEIRPVIYARFTSDKSYNKIEFKHKFRVISKNVFKDYSLKNIVYGKKKILDQKIFKAMKTSYAGEIDFKFVIIEKLSYPKDIKDGFLKINIKKQEVQRTKYLIRHDTQKLKYMRHTFQKKYSKDIENKIKDLETVIRTYPDKIKILRNEIEAIKKKMSL